MANFGPQLRDSASIYRDEMDNRPESRFDSGIQNARTERSSERSPSSRLDEGRRHRTKARQYIGRQETDESDNNNLSKQNQRVSSRYHRDQNQINKPNTARSKKSKVHTSDLARVRGVTFGFVTMSWLVPIYFFWQLPISIVASIMLGLALQVEASYLLTAVDTATQAVGSLFGYEYVDLMAIGILTVASAAAFGVFSACIAGLTALIWRLNPLSGNAAGTKKLTFVVGVVGACIPFMNMFPWIIFWILIMMRYPK